MTSQMRPYRKTRRADLEALTVRRITEAAVHLHGTLGPSRTSMSAVARKAGVRRSTLYHHFGDETALFQACTAHFMAANPLPDLDRWASISTPDERLAAALTELYAYYRRTARMMENILRDEDAMPVVRHMLRGYRDYIAAARDILCRGRGLRGRGGRRTTAAVGHALAFSTWSSLARDQGIEDGEAARLMGNFVKGAA